LIEILICRNIFAP